MTKTLDDVSEGLTRLEGEVLGGNGVHFQLERTVGFLEEARTILGGLQDPATPGAVQSVAQALDCVRQAAFGSLGDYTRTAQELRERIASV